MSWQASSSRFTVGVLVEVGNFRAEKMMKSKPDAQNDADVQAAVQKVADELGQEGRILVRESGTEPVIRVMVEAGSDELCEKYVDEVIDVIRAKGHIVS